MSASPGTKIAGSKGFKMNSHRQILKIFTALAIIFLAFSWQVNAKPDLKNIIIISIDTLRADHLGCYGYPLDTSPHIDALARDGVRFANGYSLTPLTAPSFSTVLTSLPPYKHGAKRNGLSIYSKIKTMPYYLKRYGYRSAAIISNWPLRRKLSRLHHGFDAYYEVFTNKRYLGLTNPEGQAPAVHQKTMEWLEKNHKKRFFLWVQYTDPHAPYILHDNHTFDYGKIKSSVYPPGTRMKRIKKYDSEIAYTDMYVGKLIEKLKSLGLYDEALIVFHSDHGESFGEHNYLKHGKKLYNSTLHVPLIVKLPHNTLKNTVRRDNVCLMDIAPSIFSILNLPIYPHMEGIALINGKQPPVDRTIVLETYAGLVSNLRRKTKKFHLSVKPIRYGIIQGPHKVIYNLKAKTFEAYRIAGDPFEISNIFARQYQGVVRMKESLLSSVNQIGKYIKVSRSYGHQNTHISQEDLDMLKSLGYID
jgi:arylsulfatase A-like enzyme